MSADFIPQADENYLQSLRTLKTKAHLYATSFTVDQLAAVDGFPDAFSGACDGVDGAKNNLKSKVTDKNTMRAYQEGLIRKMRGSIMQKTDTTQMMLADLGWLGPEDTTDMATARPELLITLGTPVNGVPAANVTVKDKLKSQGIDLFCATNGGAKVYCGRITRAHGVDCHPLAVTGKSETRVYTAYFVMNDHQVGLESQPFVFTMPA